MLLALLCFAAKKFPGGGSSLFTRSSSVLPAAKQKNRVYNFFPNVIGSLFLEDTLSSFSTVVTVAILAQGTRSWLATMQPFFQ